MIRAGTLAELRKFSSYNYVQPTYSVDTTIKISLRMDLKTSNSAIRKITYSKTIVIKSNFLVNMYRCMFIPMIQILFT